MATALHHLSGVGERAQVCLRKAAECERAAVLAIEPRLQAMYHDLARQWRQMAAQSEELEQRYSAAKEQRQRVPAVPDSGRDWTSR